MANKFAILWHPPARDPFKAEPYLEAIEEDLADLGEEIKEEFEDVVSDWKTKVTFRKLVRVTPAEISVLIGPASNAKIWHFVDKGTRAHVIRAKTPRGLKYRKGYSSRTRPGKAHTGTGTATGEWRNPMEVNHPGTEAREFTKTIMHKYEPEVHSTIMDAIRKGQRG